MNGEKYILYIDDDPDDRENFGYVLKKCNANISLRTANDANDALEKLTCQPKPTCIYLDINMPRINGLQFLRLLKANNEFSRIPVIMFSTAMDPRSEEEALGLGAAAAFRKPSSLQGLLEHLQCSISTHF